jgi:hypothetical protein
LPSRHAARGSAQLIRRFDSGSATRISAIADCSAPAPDGARPNHLAGQSG